MAENSLSIAEKVEIIKIIGENVVTVREAARIFNDRHPNRPAITFSTVSKISRTFNQTGNVSTVRSKNYNRNNVNENRILQEFRNNPKLSIRQASLNLNINKEIIRRTLKKNNVKPFKPKILHTLLEGDNERRLDYALWMQGEFLNNRNFLKHIIFCDEATFSTNGVVSTQNMRHWATENPHWIVHSKNQYVHKVNVWCAILNEQVIGPFFIQNLNAQNFLNFLEREFSDFLDNIPLNIRENLYFLLDGAPAHSSLVIRNWLDTNFPMKWIGPRSSLQEFPPRSPDLTPMDFYFWGNIKNKVYFNRPRTQEQLRQRITEACQSIARPELRQVIGHIRKRVEECIRLAGGYVEVRRIH